MDRNLADMVRHQQPANKQNPRAKPSQEDILEQAYQSLFVLIQAVANISELVSASLQEEMRLWSSAVDFVGKHLVDLIRQALRCEQVALFSFDPLTGRVQYLAMSGFTPEQEQIRQESSGRFTLADYLDEDSIARLTAHQEVIEDYALIRLPFAEKPDYGPRNALWVPIFIDQRFAGCLTITKVGRESIFPAEEIEITKTIADLTVYVIESSSTLNRLRETQDRESILQETKQLIDEFLKLASHELRTPLTSVLGNIQLAQRRLQTLKSQVAEQSESLSKQVEQVQNSLESASLGAFQQKRMIEDIIDDTEIQAHTLKISRQSYDLIKLVRETVAAQQRQFPERIIHLDIQTKRKDLPVLIDKDRIRRVVSIYLLNALNYSPIDRPITARLTARGDTARFSVHDEGPGIAPEDQKRLWKRFYRAKGLTIQHELDLSLGLDLYLCREFIKRHHGRVGLQSEIHHGATFWLTLPIAQS